MESDNLAKESQCFQIDFEYFEDNEALMEKIE